MEYRPLGRQVGILAPVPPASGLRTGQRRPDTRFVSTGHHGYNRQGRRQRRRQRPAPLSPSTVDAVRAVYDERIRSHVHHRWWAVRFSTARA